MIKELAREMFLEVIGEFATSIAEESVKNVKVLKIIADEIFQQTQCTTVDSLLRLGFLSFKNCLLYFFFLILYKKLCLI